MTDVTTTWLDAVPAERVEAAARAIHAEWCRWGALRPWDRLTGEEREVWMEQARTVIGAFFGGCKVVVQRSLRGEDADGPWLVFVSEEDWPHEHHGKRFTRLEIEINTPWEEIG